jgi:DNA-binding NarL/FixJ family response regulator
MPKASSKPKSTTTKLNKIISKFENTNAKLEGLDRKMDMLIVIELAKCGLNRKEVADVLEVSEDTIERMLPFGKIKQQLGKD